MSSRWNLCAVSVPSATGRVGQSDLCNRLANLQNLLTAKSLFTSTKCCEKCPKVAPIFHFCYGTFAFNPVANELEKGMRRDTTQLAAHGSSPVLVEATHLLDSRCPMLVARKWLRISNGAIRAVHCPGIEKVFQSSFQIHKSNQIDKEPVRTGLKIENHYCMFDNLVSTILALGP